MFWDTEILLFETFFILFIISLAAICTDPCIHGHCLQPENCTCEPGWTGSVCSEGDTSMNDTQYTCEFSCTECSNFYTQ